MLAVEADPGTEIEGHHVDMGLHGLQHLQSLDNAVIEVEQFLVVQAVDINRHGQDPSAWVFRQTRFSNAVV